MARIGTLVAGRFASLSPKELLTPGGMGVPSALYEVVAELEKPLSPEDETRAANAVYYQLGVPGMGVLGVDASGAKVRVQVTGASALSVGSTDVASVAGFPWSGLFAQLPSILTGIGILIAAITVLIFTGRVPEWAWGVVVLAGAAALVLWSFSQIIGAKRGYRY